MHKFKNNVSDGWLFKQELRLFKNFASNWKREVDDSDFFDVFSNSNNSDSEEAVEFFTANFTREELKPIDGIRIEDDGTAKVRPNGCWNGRPSIRGSIDGVIRDIWNTNSTERRGRVRRASPRRWRRNSDSTFTRSGKATATAIATSRKAVSPGFRSATIRFRVSGA